MKLSDFDYILPKELIAQNPIKQRDKCRLMVLEKNRVMHKRFCNLPDFLNKGDVLVVNDTKVLNNKMVGKKTTGARAEVIIEKKRGKQKYDAIIKTRNPKKGDILLNYARNT